MAYLWLIPTVILAIVLGLLFWPKDGSNGGIIRKVHREVPQHIEVRLMGYYYSMPISTYRDIFCGYIAETTSHERVVKITHIATSQSVTLPIRLNEFIERSQNYDPNLLTELGEAGIDYSIIFRSIRKSQL